MLLCHTCIVLEYTNELTWLTSLLLWYAKSFMLEQNRDWSRAGIDPSYVSQELGSKVIPIFLFSSFERKRSLANGNREATVGTLSL